MRKKQQLQKLQATLVSAPKPLATPQSLKKSLEVVIVHKKGHIQRRKDIYHQQNGVEDYLSVPLYGPDTRRSFKLHHLKQYYKSQKCGYLKESCIRSRSDLLFLCWATRVLTAGHQKGKDPRPKCRKFPPFSQNYPKHLGNWRKRKPRRRFKTLVIEIIQPLVPQLMADIMKKTSSSR